MKVLITGATGGIGMSIIQVLIENGCNVIAVGRNKKILDEMQNRYMDKIITHSLDLKDTQALDNFLNKFQDEDIDMLINGAGVGEIGYLENISDTLIKNMIEININATVKFTTFFYKKMLSQGKGTIVNISSTAGFQEGGPLMSVYYASKSFVNSFTLGLYEEAKERGVDIILLAPGPTWTNFRGMKSSKSMKKRFFISTSESVATVFWRGFKAKKNIIIVGHLNKFLYFFQKLLPLKLKLKNIKKIQEIKLKNL